MRVPQRRGRAASLSTVVRDLSCVRYRKLSAASGAAGGSRSGGVAGGSLSAAHRTGCR
jgi:hypothetical protein